MYAIDFEYDGQYLSDYDFIVCNFNSASGTDIVTAGSKITFNTVPFSKGKRHSLTSAQYDERIQTTFDVCKNPDIFDYEDMQISNDEYRDIMRWLNRRDYYKFQVLDENDVERDACFFNASFNVEKIKIGEILYGLRLTMETDRPFGYGQERHTTLIFSENELQRLFIDTSDEIGSVCPFLKITCHADGDLWLHNDLEDCMTLIRKCTAGEVITFDGMNHLVCTSNNDHNICNDFNYEFFKIGNTFHTRNNLISASMPCEVEIKYSPIIKDAP